MTRAPALVLGLLAGTVLASCAPAEASPSTVTVYAAASLTGPFANLEREFENRHPGVDVVVVHGGSTDLAAAISAGAPADVFASADQVQMDTVAAQRIDAPIPFATNSLTLIVEHGNPLGLMSLADLEHPDVVTVICAPLVPCGTATSRLAGLEGVRLSPSSEERSVTDVLGKVASGQADAGVVYATDAARSTAIEAVPLPGTDRVTSTYQIAALNAGTAPALGRDFVALVTSAVGREIMADHGFGHP